MNWDVCGVVIVNCVVVCAKVVEQVEVVRHSCHTIYDERASVGCHSESKHECC